MMILNFLFFLSLDLEYFHQLMKTMLELIVQYLTYLLEFFNYFFLL
jgi:hypothetical protein